MNEKLTALCHKLSGAEFIRFVLVGILATGIHYGIYLLLKTVMVVWLAYTLGYAISLLCNFLLSARFTFRTHVSGKRGVGFLVGHGVNYLLHMGLLNLFLALGVSEALAPIPVYCIAVPVNFVLIRTVFKKL